MDDHLEKLKEGSKVCQEQMDIMNAEMQKIQKVYDDAKDKLLENKAIADQTNEKILNVSKMLTKLQTEIDFIKNGSGIKTITAILPEELRDKWMSMVYITVPIRDIDAHLENIIYNISYDDVIIQMCFVSYGKCQGLCETYYPNGNIRSRLFFKNNQPYGPCKTWYISGLQHMQGTYIDGSFQGVLTISDESGNVKEYIQDIDGKFQETSVKRECETRM